jgi:putative MATE family efflux protein
MKDLTQGSILKHLVTMALPMAIGMFVQTLYVLTDLYFVGQLGGAAIAGLSLSGNIMFFIFALSQIFNIGTATTMAHSVGEKNQLIANRIFNQAVMSAVIATFIVLTCGVFFSHWYLTTSTTDVATISAGLSYLYWFLPCMALQFLMVTFGAALRSCGSVKPMMIAQAGSLIINIVLSPILITGAGTGYAMGIAGAGLASSISVVAAVLYLWFYLVKKQQYIILDIKQWLPDTAIILRIANIGFPAGAEFLLMFVYMTVTYWAIQRFGADAQAGFGLGSKVIQALFLPVMALAFTLPAVAGQNYGAKKYERVKSAFYWTALLTVVFMLAVSLVSYFQPYLLVRYFSNEPEVIRESIVFLQIVCFNYLATGFIFACSGFFQGIGNTWPAFLSTSTRLVSFVLPAVYMTLNGGYSLADFWYLSVYAVIIQAVISIVLLMLMWKKLGRDSFSEPNADVVLAN